MDHRKEKRKEIKDKKMTKHIFKTNLKKWKSIQKGLKKVDRERRERKEMYEIIVYKDRMISKLREKNNLLAQALERMSEDYEDLKNRYEKQF